MKRLITSSIAIIIFCLGIVGCCANQSPEWRLRKEGKVVDIKFLGGFSVHYRTIVYFDDSSVYTIDDHIITEIPIGEIKIYKNDNYCANKSYKIQVVKTNQEIIK